MRIFSFVWAILLLFSCARQGTPTGGPRDEEPPKFISANPDTLSLQVSTDLKEINLQFDEYLVLKDHTQNIIISPPLGSTATFTPVGSPSKNIRIKLNEALQANTTYNINFGQAIQDNNEGNKLPYFQYVFSTGDFIDSLEINGRVRVPFLRKQPEHLMVGLYKVDSTYSDSLLIKKKPFYVAKVNEKGAFKLNYLSAGKYQLMAFDDELQNMQYDFGKEKFGFYDEIIDFQENNAVDYSLNLFDQKKDYRAGKAEQKGYGHLLFRFEGEPEDISVEALDFNFTTASNDFQARQDSMNFWFDPSIDSIEERTRRIHFLVKHKTQVDSVSLVYSNATKHQLKLEKLSKLSEAPNRKVDFHSNYPIARLDSTQVKVWKDTLQLPVKITPHLTSKQAFSMEFPIELNAQYDIEFLPELVTDIFGKTNDSLTFSFQTKTKNELGNLGLNLVGKPAHPFWLQLLNEKDEVLVEEYTQAAEFNFPYLQPGNYYFKILVDENENGHWDTGDFFLRKQAEKAFIYPTLINVRPLWEMVETWQLSDEKLPKATEEAVEEETVSNEKSPS
ncbi:MAG TPA: Ig-like domain-containing protein [Moheibacter sp.]|nr:Ig-like domain-containing protein [Moheibacter sp.]